MAEPSSVPGSDGSDSPQEALGRFLRSLRQSFDDVNVTQKQFADALGASSALVSSWENGEAVPPEYRLEQYARFYATPRSVQSAPAALVPGDDLTKDEEREREGLIDKLVRLREEALHKPSSPKRGALGGRFWFFPDGQAVTIICTPLSRKQLLGEQHQQDEVSREMVPFQQYALNPTHPNAITNFNNGDIDALIELAGHIRAENPAIDVQWRMTDAISSVDDLSGHVVILGGGDSLVDDPSRGGTVVSDFLRQMELPIRIIDVRGGDEEFDLQFAVLENEQGQPDPFGSKRETYGARFRRDEGKPERPRVIQADAPVLEYDLALMARRPNPLNASATVTMCTGLFSRGTYGAVRSFTDANLRTRTEQYIGTKNPDDFWMLIQVPIFGGERTVTPELGRPFHRLRTSA